jgi:hypothetical protein
MGSALVVIGLLGGWDLAEHGVVVAGSVLVHEVQEHLWASDRHEVQLDSGRLTVQVGSHVDRLVGLLVDALNK